MSSKRSSAGTGVSVGGSSILLIFVLLALTTFAVLSLVSAVADRNLTDKSALAATQYYEADSKAEEILARIGAALGSISGNGEDAFYSEAGPVLFAIDAPILIDGNKVSYAVPLNDSQELRVSLTLAYSSSPKLFEINEWKVVNTGEWHPEEESLNLWTGSENFVIIG
ncbi:MAG: hypothetical protein FWG94_04415 [Oscillospiraceae bacterium]|nr:hypothetical protein [Oscillospiraceae bacterium]